MPVAPVWSIRNDATRFLDLEHQYREMHRVVAPAQLTLALE